jgi:hypothetical protein
LNLSGGSTGCRGVWPPRLLWEQETRRFESCHPDFASPTPRGGTGHRRDQLAVTQSPSGCGGSTPPLPIERLTPYLMAQRKTRGMGSRRPQVCLRRGCFPHGERGMVPGSSHTAASSWFDSSARFSRLPMAPTRRGRSSTAEPLVVNQPMSVQLRPVTPKGRGVTAEHGWLQPSRSGFESWRPCHADEALTVERLAANEEDAGSIPVIRSHDRVAQWKRTWPTCRRSEVRILSWSLPAAD